ncbi:MAG: hypothetical protein M1834_003225 [Cirrosporium novae-zelandiae]|nr:MAG: hypothetical protein M1834_003225 [Cirrosporium novae-zelandiae]
MATASISTLSFAMNITILQPDKPFVLRELPESHATTDGDAVVELFQNLGRTTSWKLVEKVKFEGDTYEPEGIVRFGDNRYFVSAGEYTASTVKYNTTINGTDRTAGAGFAHLIIFDGNGSRIADATITERGAIEYHNGGLDWDGEYIWATIAQYRPNTTATVIKIDPRTLQTTKIFHASDHLGGIVHDTKTNNIVTLNWGARNSSTWNLDQKFNKFPLFTSPQATSRNPTYFIDYQDCKFLGHSQIYGGRAIMICSGVATINDFNLGGLAIVDLETMVPLAEVPITMTSDLDVPVTQNPIDVNVVEGQLRAYFLPDQHNSTLYVYEAQIQSPYEF